jgi:hypothetical protein
MLLNHFSCQVVRWLLLTAVLVIFITAALASAPVYAGECESVASGSCG